MSRVFLVEPNHRYDTTRAGQYGEVTPLLKEQMSPFKTDVFTKRIREAIQHHAFDPAEDYLCMTGTMLNLSLTLSIITCMFDQPIRLLLFDAPSCTYFERLFSPN